MLKQNIRVFINVLYFYNRRNSEMRFYLLISLLIFDTQAELDI